jgi:hypothetical protein
MAKTSVGAALPGCNVSGCDGLATRRAAGLCEKHYYRLRRNGHYELHSWPPLVEHSHGYRLVYAPNHPLATPGQKSRVYEHRAVYFAEHGEGPFACRWCSQTVTWSDMHVDHLDDDRANNDPANLAASCPTCNQWRGHNKMVRTARAKAKQLEWNGKRQSLGEWAEELQIPLHRLRQRIKAEWSVERALTEPRGPTGPVGVSTSLKV